ncbi:hypothetical protein [Streptomyces sp. NBC_01235]|uniref:hypothetical protein n=1 Tax=Streptomyces sp. NBC_01235 TaxID=2903788 RepID=UPI002E13453E|nr:hypothetical protein OG289_31495 [Streptomyces sp. NBC_01235]
MADKQDRWLDRETAERLLRGESLDHAVDGAAGEQAERLATTLGALSALAAEPLPADEELPGEAAALAAFRKAHADRTDLTAHRPDPAGRAEPAGGAEPAGRADVADAGLVRIGDGRSREAAGRRPRWSGWSGPVRMGLAAALAVGMVGGAAAVTGVLPTPFDDAEPARPAVSAPALPDGPLVSPKPDAMGGDAPSATPDSGTGDTGSEAGGGAGNGGAGDDTTAAPDLRGTWPTGVTSSCRDLRTGKILDTERRRTLEKLAGGSKRVPKYCAGVLDGTGNSGGDGRTGTGTGSGSGSGKGQGDRGSQGGQAGLSGQTGQAGPSGSDGTSDRGGDTDDDGDHDRGGDGGGHHGRHGSTSGGSDASGRHGHRHHGADAPS